ncbi:MAG: hypothetical protein U9N40_01525 [Euryarchaeota archaeon]|nr:hypothetical protein [Euryarchaeota archaeon]
MTTDYYELAELTDRIFAISDGNNDKLVELLDTLDKNLKHELLSSDFLNAGQVFYYFFRTIPDKLAEERMILQPASALKTGLMIEEHDLLEIVFSVRRETGELIVTDGERELATFSGSSAYQDAVNYVNNYAI